jgi:MoxR-like ATPase
VPATTQIVFAPRQRTATFVVPTLRDSGSPIAEGIETFFVIATQNPLTQIGTFPLPESQLDRFLMRLELGVPDRSAERAMLEGADRRDLLSRLQPAMDSARLLELQKLSRRVHVAPPLLDYLQDLLAASRQIGRGLSPRAGLAVLQAARAWALMEGRPMVIPEDIHATGVAVMGHRLDGAETGTPGNQLAARLLRETAVL